MIRLMTGRAFTVAVALAAPTAAQDATDALVAYMAMLKKK
jgi:hypothetical protein